MKAGLIFNEDRNKWQNNKKEKKEEIKKEKNNKPKLEGEWRNDKNLKVFLFFQP